MEINRELLLAEHNNPKDEVYQFCKKNGIEITWDSARFRTEFWNEILLDGKMTIQVQQGIKLSQFLNAIQLIAKDYRTEEFPDDLEDFWICTGETKEDEKRFMKFVERYSDVLGIKTKK